MKLITKTVGISVIGASLLALTPQRTYAGDKGWETAGKVLAGVAVVGAIAAIASHHDAAVSVSYEYEAPRREPRYAPRPPAHCPPPPPQPARGHYEVRRELVTIPGYWTEVREPARYEWVTRGCRRDRVMVQPPCTRRVWVPQRAEWREQTVWVPAPPPHQRYARAW